MLEEKLNLDKELHDIALLKRKEAERLTRDLSSAEIRKSEKRRIAESCMQVCQEAERVARQEALQREQERMAAEQRERERLEEAARRQALFDTAKRKLSIHDGDPFAIWLSDKANGEFLVDIYIAFELVQRYAYNNGLISAPLLTIIDTVLVRRIQDAIRVKKDFMKLDANTRYYCGLAKVISIAQRFYAEQSGRYGDVKLLWGKDFRISYTIDNLVFEGKLPEREYNSLHAAIIVACHVFCVKNELMWGCLPIILDGAEKAFRYNPREYLAYIKELPNSQVLILKHESEYLPGKSLINVSNVYTYVLETDEGKTKARITYPKKQ